MAAIVTLSVKKVWMLFSIVALVMAMLLVQQYLFFKSQVRELRVLRDHYQEHLDVLKRVIADVVTADKTNASAHEKAHDEKPQLHQSLRSYLQQKDTSIDVRDLQEIYRSFNQTAELRQNDAITPPELEATEPVQQVVKPAVKKVERVKSVSKKKHALSWPLERSKFWISSFFGRRKIAHKWGFHMGIDLAALKGTPVRAAAAGLAIEAGASDSGYGNTILLQHENGYKTRYAHLDRVRIKRGSTIKRGQFIATVGNTGNVRGNGTDASHLHFEVHRYNRPVNPLYHLN